MSCVVVAMGLALQVVNLHYLVAARVYHLHRDAPVLADRERQGLRAAECLESVGVNHAFQRKRFSLSHALESGKNAWVMQKVRPS